MASVLIPIETNTFQESVISDKNYSREAVTLKEAPHRLSKNLMRVKDNMEN